MIEAQRKQLGKALWSWSLCAQCDIGKQCVEAHCPVRRLVRLKRYMQYIEEQQGKYISAYGESASFTTVRFEDLLVTVSLLRSHPDSTRSQILSKIEAAAQDKLQKSCLESTLDFAVRIATMIGCSKSYGTDFLEHGLNPIPWRPHVPYSDYIIHAFPEGSALSAGSEKNEACLIEPHLKLKASKLSKRAGLKFRPTNDITSHLKLNRKARTVEIFHHASFLKEQLRLTRDVSPDITVTESLKLGALPRQIVLEIQDSLQCILFPLSHRKSKKLLLSLIKHASFDPECKNWDFASIRRPEENAISYQYFGARLTDLYEELENPKPQGWLQTWIERKSGARYVMWATLYALFIGTMGLVVGILQTYFAYQAWKHPI